MLARTAFRPLTRRSTSSAPPVLTRRFRRPAARSGQPHRPGRTAPVPGRQRRRDQGPGLVPADLNVLLARDRRHHAGRWAGKCTASAATYDGGRRLPACQSSCVPAASGSTPKLRSWGRSRRLRLSSAKPGKPARPVTWSQSRTASSGPGSRLITGPKKAVPSGGLPGSPGRFPGRGPLRTVRATRRGTRLKQAARALQVEVRVSCAGGPGAPAGRMRARGGSGHRRLGLVCRGSDSWRLSPCG